jgi:GMP synthase (glutamine-hydrolysing)
LGICYGHQILAHVFGGAVSTLPQMVRDERLPLAWQVQDTSGILPSAVHIRAFAEHRDYVSQVPEGFEVLCRAGPVPYVMVHPQRALVGLQFVPEQSDAAGKQLLKRFVGAA